MSLVKGTTVDLSCCEPVVINGDCVKVVSALTLNNTDWTVSHKKENREEVKKEKIKRDRKKEQKEEKRKTYAEESRKERINEGKKERS
jgi:hypothetical protein